MAAATADASFAGAFPSLLRAAFRVAYRILGETSAAEDVAAEALARSFADWDRVRVLTRPDAWVVRVASNIAIDSLRRRRPRMERAIAADPQEIAVSRISLGQALKSLPKRQREVVVLRHLAGLSEAEVAQVLGISPGAVKSHGHRALIALRLKIKSMDEEFQPDIS